MQFKNLENQEKEQSSAAQLNSDSENQSKAIAPPPLKLKASAIQKKANEEEELSVQAKKDNSTQFADSDDSDDNSSSNTGNGTGSNPPPDNNAGEPFQLSSENSLSDNKSTGKERYNYSAASKGSSKLPKDVRGKMENAFQADFSNVNIHTNSEKAKEVGAYAFTQGEDIHFAPGQYQPFSLDGQKLIGHELTHVEHQRNGKVEPTVQTKGMPVNNDQKLEKEADEKGTMAAQGKVVNIAASGSASSKGVSEPVIQKSGNESGLVSNEEQDSYIGSYVNIRGFVRASNGIRSLRRSTHQQPE